MTTNLIKKKNKIRKMTGMFLIPIICIAFLCGAYSLTYFCIYDEYKQESFQREIVDSLGPQNEKRNFIEMDIELGNQQKFTLTIAAYNSDEYIRSTIHEHDTSDTYFLIYSDGTMIVQKNSHILTAMSINKSDYFDKVYQLKMNWEKSKCDVSINSFSLNKSINSADVQFVFEKDYTIELYLPILSKTFLIENAIVSYKLRLKRDNENNYTWPALFFLTGISNNEKLAISYLQ